MTDINEDYKAADKLKDEGKLEEAVAKLQGILETQPDHTLSHLALAVIYGRLNQHQKAVEHGKKACEIDPTDAFNFTALSVTCQRAWAGTQDQSFITAAEDAMAKAHEIQGR